jgi:hypothetical protein
LPPLSSPSLSSSLIGGEEGEEEEEGEEGEEEDGR